MGFMIPNLYHIWRLPKKTCIHSKKTFYTYRRNCVLVGKKNIDDFQSMHDTVLHHPVKPGQTMSKNPNCHNHASRQHSMPVTMLVPQPRSHQIDPTHSLFITIKIIYNILMLVLMIKPIPAIVCVHTVITNTKRVHSVV